ncbi:MAG: zinc-binding alcohol dehydrogenase [bacterium]
MATYQGKRITFTGKGKVEILDREQTGPGPGEVLIETICSGVSPGTELSRLYDTHSAPRPFPQNTGYCSCGRVVELGSGVSGVNIGDVVLAGYGHLSHMVFDARKVIPVPAGLAQEEAVLVQLGQVGLQGIRHADIRLGDSVLVVGLGLIGQFAQILARVAGGQPVVGVDLSERRLEMARATGLTHALNPKAPDYKERLAALAPNGRFRVTIDSTGTPDVISGLFERTADDGAVIVLGGVHRPVTLDLYSHFQKRNLRLIAAGGFSPRHWPHSDLLASERLLLDLLAAGRFPIKPLITHLVPFEQAPEMYRMLNEAKDQAMGVVFQWKRG